MIAGTVLIVDDSLTVRMDLAEAFESAGFTTALCATFAEARAALEDRTWNVVILDVLLPDGDGVDLLTAIRTTPRHQDVGVLMLSSEAEVADRVRGLRLGADEYVGKPYDTDNVVARARDLVRARHPTSVSTSSSVLLIDDSATVREALRHAFEQDGYLVTTADSGEEGLRSAASGRHNVVVVDESLPGISGGTVIRRIRLDSAQGGGLPRHRHRARHRPQHRQPARRSGLGGRGPRAGCHPTFHRPDRA